MQNEKCSEKRKKIKRSEQLGMSVGKAQYRLYRDILFNLIPDKTCYHCGKPICRDTFSIEHKAPWIDSDDPKGLFFDLDNIAFSHKSCNYRYTSNRTKETDQ